MPYWQYVVFPQRGFWPSWFYILFLCQSSDGVQWRKQNLPRALSSVTSNNHSWLVTKFSSCNTPYNPDFLIHYKFKMLYELCQLALFSVCTWKRKLLVTLLKLLIMIIDFTKSSYCSAIYITEKHTNVYSLMNFYKMNTLILPAFGSINSTL